MRRLIIIINLIFISTFCFAQQNIPGKIIGRIPDAYSLKTYQIQVGAFKIPQNAENVIQVAEERPEGGERKIS